MTPSMTDYSELERQLLNNFQHGFPLCEQPYAEMAQQLGVTEEQVINTLQLLQERKVVSRVGPVFRTGRVGASTLAAMAVPSERLEAIAELVNAYEAVNHNYEREHDFNLWFVVTAANEAELQHVLLDIERCSGIRVMRLPMLEDYHIDLGFELQWK